MIKTIRSTIFNTYRGRLLAGMGVLVLLMFILFYIDRLFLTEQVVFEREQNRIDNYGLLLSSHILGGLIDNDPDAIREDLASADLQQDIGTVSFLDKDGQVIYSSVDSLEGKPTPNINSTDIHEKGNIFYQSFPLYINSNLQGYLQVGYSLEHIHRELTVDNYRFLAICFVMFSAMMFLAYIISSALLQPLYSMKNVAYRIANGDFTARTPVISKDVVGTLGTAMNNMAGQLGELTGGLQQRINIATYDLEQMNATLLAKTDELESSNRRLTELDKLKSDFVSTVSHELRTPLTSIIGFAKTLLNLKLTDAQKQKYLTIIEAEGKRLASLIDEFLDISKIESGYLVLKTEPIDITDTLRKVLETLQLRINFKVNLQIPENIGLIEADEERLRRCILNLIDNAIKYNDPKKPIDITVVSTDSAITVSVRDYGPGISPDDLPFIFDKFYRGKDPIFGKIRGSGLGLAIVKGIVEAHNGEIQARTETDGGANFTLEIPRNRV